MRKTPPAASAGLAERLIAFVLERFPFALPIVQPIAARAVDPEAFSSALDARLDELAIPLDAAEPTPGVRAGARLEHARRELRDACRGFLERAAIAESLSADERR